MPLKRQRITVDAKAEVGGGSWSRADRLEGRGYSFIEIEVLGSKITKQDQTAGPVAKSARKARAPTVLLIHPVPSPSQAYISSIFHNPASNFDAKMIRNP